MTNTEKYIQLLEKCLNNPCEDNIHDIKYEILDASMSFNPYELIEGSNIDYINNEIDWYNSKDLCIFGHKGIEDNRIWKACATDKGMLNSNYGWCVFSNENYNQFERAVNSIVTDNYTKQAVIMFSRPSINIEYCDKIHANRDMICTIYSNELLRNGLLHHHVHMRSNDIWFGMRNDLAWQIYLQQEIVKKLNDKGVSCKCGPIVWHADSLHIYEYEIKSVNKYLDKYGGKNE